MAQTYQELKDNYNLLNFQNKSLECQNYTEKINNNLTNLREEYKLEKKELKRSLTSKYNDKGLKVPFYEEE